MKIILKKSVCCILLLIISQVSLSGKQDSTDSKGVFAYPVLFYTPETRWAYGAAMTIFSRDSTNTRPSSWIPMLVYTQNKQILAKVTACLYGKNEKWQLESWLGYYDYPDQFYGIGNQTTNDQKESYTARRVVIQFSPRLRILSNLYAGIQIEFMNQALSLLKEDGQLIRGNIPGSQKSQYSGTGVLISRDTRDNIYFPMSGYNYTLQCAGFGSALGSDFTFQRLTLDLRHYFQVYFRHIIAVQAYSQMIFGTAPFQSLSRFGGSQLMRGYYEGRYRDNHALIIQTEYRWLFTRQLGVVLFAGIGEVTHHLDDFQLSNARYSIGFGFRFCINPDEKLNIRLDFGYGKNTSGYYMEVFEAF